MRLLVIGSAAMNRSDKTTYWRQEVDLDLICSKADFVTYVKELIESGARLRELKFDAHKAVFKYTHKDQFKIVEASFLDVPHALQESDKEIFEYCLNSPYRQMVGNTLMYIAPLHIVYMMKLSHRYKKDSVHFLKTMKDIKELRAGSNEDEIYFSRDIKAMLVRREAATYTNSLPKLNQKKDTFFEDSVPYKYDHDTIHEAVKLLDRPAYTYYMKDGEQVMCDKEKFFAAPKSIRLFGVLEESYVLALERAVIPFGTDPKRAFDIALSKVCTSITSGWFREFAWENYEAVQDLYHESFVAKFNKALEDGKILPFTRSMYSGT